MDLEKIRFLANTDRKLHEYINQELEKCAPDDPPMLSDLIIKDQDGGLQVLQALEAYYKDLHMPDEQRFRWKLLIMRDDWGNVPNPGDEYILRIKKPYKHRDGKSVTIGELNIDKATGMHDEKWIREVPYIVDSKGCITCTYDHAMILLRRHGMYYKTGKGGPPLSMHKIPHSPEVAKCPDGSHKHKWYWQVKEVDKETYDKMPDRIPSDEPKRGIGNVKRK
jgi:hypothetical protein